MAQIDSTTRGLSTSKRGSARMPTPSCYDRTLERAVSFVAVAPEQPYSTQTSVL